MRSFLVFWLLLVTGLAQAQPRKPDTIIKTNAASLIGYVVRVTETKVQYRLSAKPDAALYTLPRSQVRSIRYSSGKTVQIMARTLLLPQPIPADSPARPSDVLLPDSSTVATAPTPPPFIGGLPVTTPNPEQPVPELPRTSYHYMAVTVGAEGNYVIPALSPQWADDAIGLGIRRNLGGYIQVDRRLSKFIGLSARVGYQFWQVDRHYNQQGLLQYSSSDKLAILSAHLGPKFFICKGLYILPQATIVGLRLIRTSSADNPLAAFSDTQQAACWGGTGSVGYAAGAGNFVADISIGYSYLPGNISYLIYNNRLTDPLHIIVARIGIGYRTNP